MGVAAGISFGCYSADEVHALESIRGRMETRRRGEDLPRERRLVRANDHGVDGVESDCEQHPEDGREEEAAHDFDYGVDGEEATVGVLVGEAGISGLYGWECWCLHSSYLHRQV